MRPNLTIRDLALLARSAGVAAFTPASLPNLLGWWEADSLALSDADPVPTWGDQSVNANHLAQATSGNRPIYKTNIVNGKPVVRFDGSNDFFSLTSTMTLGSAWSWLVILSNTSSGGVATFGHSSTGDGFEHNFVNIKAARVISTAGATNTAVFSGAETTWKMASAIGNIGGETKIRENKTDRTGAAVTPMTPTINVFGQRAGGSFFVGDVAAACVYGGNLTTAQMDQVYDGYFKARYGLP